MAQSLVEEEAVSRAWLDAQLMVVLREIIGPVMLDEEAHPDDDISSVTVEVGDDGLSSDLLRGLIEVLISDIVDRGTLLDFGFWDEIESWGKKDGRKKAALRFMRELVQAFAAAFGRHRKHLLGIVNAFLVDPGKRYAAAGYYELVLDTQHTIWARLPMICVIGGHASGDMFGIGATALLKEDMAVVVYKYDKADQDHADGMHAFFTELLGKDRVRLADSYADALDRAALKGSVFELMRTRGTPAWLAPYNMGTYFLGSRFQKSEKDLRALAESRRTVRQAFHVERLKQEDAIVSFLQSHLGSLDELAARRVIVLWSRFTGKKGEYHPEHDTSFKGMAQMAWLAAELGYNVIIAGDKPIVHEGVSDTFTRKYHYQEIASSLEAYYRTPRCFNLTEFWTEQSWKALSAGKRIVQYQLYEVLHRRCDVRHLGMRSGNLEALALLGYCVRYMEEEQSYGGPRMEAWHGTEIGYERILLKEPPTRVGKYIHSLRAKVSQASVPKYITARNRGFAGTASKSEPRREAQLAERAISHAEAIGKIPEKYADRIKKLKEQQAAELAALQKTLEGEAEKPEAVRAFENGFIPEDLLKMRAFFAADNDRIEPKERRPLSTSSGVDGKLGMKQRTILMAIKRLPTKQ